MTRCHQFRLLRLLYYDHEDTLTGIPLLVILIYIYQYHLVQLLIRQQHTRVPTLRLMKIVSFLIFNMLDVPHEEKKQAQNRFFRSLLNFFKPSQLRQEVFLVDYLSTPHHGYEMFYRTILISKLKCPCVFTPLSGPTKIWKPFINE